MAHGVPDDDPFALTPIDRPDPAVRESRSRRRRTITGGVALLVVTGGIAACAVAANSGGGKPVTHTAAIPKTFGTTMCAWQSKAAEITLSPVLNHRTVVDKSAPTDLRAFLDALTIEPRKG